MAQPPRFEGPNGGGRAKIGVMVGYRTVGPHFDFLFLISVAVGLLFWSFSSMGEIYVQFLAEVFGTTPPI